METTIGGAPYTENGDIHTCPGTISQRAIHQRQYQRRCCTHNAMVHEFIATSNSEVRLFLQLSLYELLNLFIFLGTEIAAAKPSTAPAFHPARFPQLVFLQPVSTCPFYCKYVSPKLWYTLQILMREINGAQPVMS